jgi:hypothetical protein
MISKEPPVCGRCSDSPSSIAKLEQHADVLKRPSEQARPPSRIMESSSGHVSLEQPFDKDANFVTSDPLKSTNTPRRLPAWMSLLPSHRNSNVHPPKHSVLQRRSTFPYFETTRMSTPHDSPAPTPPESSNNNEVIQSTPVVNLETQPCSERTRPQLSSSWIKPQLSSSNLSFVSFVDNQPDDPDHHMGYVPEKSLCPSAYVVLPSINFSRSRQPSIAKSAPSVIDMPRNPNRNTRSRRRLSKRFPVKSVVKVTAVPEIPERTRRRSRPWKLDWSRSTSPEESLEECSKTNHTPEPSQDIEAAKPPFLKELSSFLSSRAGKWILPSRVGESRSQKFGSNTETPFCPQCGHEIISGNVCERCQSRVDVPGSWV